MPLCSLLRQCRCAIALAIVVLSASLTGLTEAADSLYINYSTRPDDDALLAFDVSILSSDSKVDLAPGQAVGNEFYGYLSLCEIANDATYRQQAESLGVAFPATNPVWKSRVADISDPRWHRFVVEVLARNIAAAGFDGFFLDTVDSVALLEAADPTQAKEFRDGLASLLVSLNAKYPEHKILINRGFDFVDNLHESIDGVLVESVLRTYDFSSKEYVAVDAATTATLTERIEDIRQRGLPVFAVDYLPANATELARATSERLRLLGCTPLITSPDLDGDFIGWNQRVARRILVLHGHDPIANEEPRIWPSDTTTTSILQMPLEWMGYELEYHDVSTGLPANDRGAGNAWAGVIIDDEIEIPYALQESYFEWLQARLRDGKKVLFVGDYPFTDEVLRQALFEELGVLAKIDKTQARLSKPRLTVADESIVNFEIEAKPSVRDFQNVRAPDGAQVILSVAAATENSETQNFDAVYATDWGGCLLAPYVVFEASEETVLTYVDPFAFLEQIFPSGNFPAPDPSTRDGLRVLYTHIDGDGFTSVSNVDETKLCGELLYERFLRDLPFPVTVSIVESEIRAHMLAQSDAEQPRYAAAAKRIFQLSHVEAASHSYSHPYVWFQGDESYSGLYNSTNVDLKLTARYPDIIAKREIAGSISYIDEALTPAGKNSTIMLWSGNCRPGVEALEEVAALGIESMNGGNTILSKRFPGMAAVAPRTIYWDDQLQVYASNQNEFMYTNGWQGPYYGGFSQVIETFEMTETPRRLKPVNVYYHFYSVERHDALKALDDIYSWCKKEPLHSLTTSQFAALTRDSHHTKLYQTGYRSWVALNEGDLRTYRLPASLGIPDLGKCRGVTGFAVHKGWIFVHTDGSKKALIALADNPDPQLHLVSSSAEIAFQRHEAGLVKFTTRDLRPIEVVLGGIPAGRRVIIDINGEHRSITPDDSGQIRLELPEQADVRAAITD